MTGRRVLRTTVPLLEGVPQVFDALSDGISGFLCDNWITRIIDTLFQNYENHEKWREALSSGFSVCDLRDCIIWDKYVQKLGFSKRVFFEHSINILITLMWL